MSGLAPFLPSYTHAPYSTCMYMAVFLFCVHMCVHMIGLLFPMSGLLLFLSLALRPHACCRQYLSVRPSVLVVSLPRPFPSPHPHPRGRREIIGGGEYDNTLLRSIAFLTLLYFGGESPIIFENCTVHRTFFFLLRSDITGNTPFVRAFPLKSAKRNSVYRGGGG